jgi:LysR family transcriptional regulator, flagellar master operon regulator
VLSQQAAAYLPLSAVSGHIERGEMRRIDNAPVFQRPIYLAYPSNPVSSDVLEVALTGLRSLAKGWTSDQGFSEGDRSLGMAGLR